MEAETSLVGADRGVVLDAEAAVDMNLAAVIHPGNPELNDALRLPETRTLRVLPAGIQARENPASLHPRRPASDTRS